MFQVEKINGNQSKIGNLNKCKKVEDQVVEKKSQEARNCIISEHIRVVEPVCPCRKETPHNRGVHDRDHVAEWFHICENMCKGKGPRDPGQ